MIHATAFKNRRRGRPGGHVRFDDCDDDHEDSGSHMHHHRFKRFENHDDEIIHMDMSDGVLGASEHKAMDDGSTNVINNDHDTLQNNNSSNNNVTNIKQQANGTQSGCDDGFNIMMSNDFDCELMSDENNNENFYTKCVWAIAHAYNILWFIPILNPVGSFRIGWNVIVSTILLCSCIEIAFTLAFDISLSLDHWTGVFALCCDVFLLTDTIINFRVSYFDRYDRLRLVTDPQNIAKRYFMGWFFIDLFTSLPFEFMVGESEVGTTLKAFRAVRIIRMVKMLGLVSGILGPLLSHRLIMFVRLCRLLFIMLIFAHFGACSWYAVGNYCLEHDGVYTDNWLTANGAEESTNWEKYSLSWYWSVGTLTTTGYGDVTATNTLEQWIASSFILVGMCLFVYFIGAVVGDPLVAGDRVRAERNKKVENAQQFCAANKLPRYLTRAVLTHTKYHCEHNFLLDEIKVLENLPSCLRMDVSAFVARQVLRKIPIFDVLDSHTIGLIALKMKSVSCNRGYKLFQANDPAKTMYIQRSGTSLLHYSDEILFQMQKNAIDKERSYLQKTSKNGDDWGGGTGNTANNGNSLITERGSTISNKKRNKLLKKQKEFENKYGKKLEHKFGNIEFEQELERGAVIGELAMTYRRRKYSLQCITWCEFYVIEIRDIFEVLRQEYPREYQDKWELMKYFAKDMHYHALKKNHLDTMNVDLDSKLESDNDRELNSTNNNNNNSSSNIDDNLDNSDSRHVNTNKNVSENYSASPAYIGSNFNSLNLEMIQIQQIPQSEKEIGINKNDSDITSQASINISKSRDISKLSDSKIQSIITTAPDPAGMAMSNVDENSENSDNKENLSVMDELGEITTGKSFTNIQKHKHNQVQKKNFTGDEARSSDRKVLSFLRGLSEISSNIISTNNNSKNKTYYIENPLIIILGIGDYDGDAISPLIGVSQDYINCMSAFLMTGYCVLYQDKQNNVQYIDKLDPKWKTQNKQFDLKQCKQQVKIHWTDDEIKLFFDQAKEHVLKYKHDSFIFVISCHGDAEGVIIDSTGEEVSLGLLFSIFNGNECQYLVDKPKIIFLDACRATMRAKPIEIVKSAPNPNSNDKNEKNNMDGVSLKSILKTKSTSDKDVANLATTIEFEQDAKSPETESKMETENMIKINDDWYHPQANFRYIYGNPDAYALADGGLKRGYLVRSIKRVFSNLEISLNETLDDMIQQIRAQTKSMAGKGTLGCVEDVSRMTYKVRFKKR